MKQHRYVWRLERDGKGAFGSGLIDDAYWYGKSNHRANPRNMPGPYCTAEKDTPVGKAFNGGDGHKYIFAFTSLKQYRQWCNSAGFRRNLAEKSGELIRYQVPKKNVLIGKHQCIFKKTRAAKKVEIRSPAYAD